MPEKLINQNVLQVREEEEGKKIIVEMRGVTTPAECFIASEKRTKLNSSCLHLNTFI